jgi:hypothetical protein
MANLLLKFVLCLPGLLNKPIYESAGDRYERHFRFLTK